MKTKENGKMRGWLFLALTLLVAGCATTTTKSGWLSVADQNTRESYEKFVKEYPDNENADEARKRIEDQDYAFLVTCRIGTQKAFEGFLASYPLSDYAPIAGAYVEFLRETRSGNLAGYKKFVIQHPDHPFVALAKVSIPALWLKETGEKVGVVVNVNERIDKGLLGGRYGDAEKMRQKVWQTLEKELEQEGIQAVLLDGLESSKITEDGVKEVVIADYSESQPPETPPPMSGPYDSPLANAFHWSAANTLSKLIHTSAVKTVLITVRGVNNGVEYYSGFRSLSSSIGSVNRGEALKTLGDHAIFAETMVALKDSVVGSSELKERKPDEELLKQLKLVNGVSFARRPDGPAVAGRKKAIAEALVEAREPATSMAEDEAN
jgi:hypothetical protein